MFSLNIKTAASTSSAAPTPAPGVNAGEAPWATIDVDEADSFESTPSTNSSGNQSGRHHYQHAAQPSHSPQSPETPIKFDHGVYPHCPIFIPSKGRSDLDRSTMAVLVRDLVPFVLVVEREEAEGYRAMLDRLVGQYFGFAGMTFAASVDDGIEGATKTGAGVVESSSTTPADLWAFPCACCCGSTSVAGSPSSPTTPGLSADALRALALRLSAAFHHGYVFEPTSAAAGNHHGAVESKNVSPPVSISPTTPSAASGGARRPSAAFVLRNVDEVRALFVIEVLPETNRGVSYVRNYILQVLVPRLMVACGVDRSGNVEELRLCGPGEHNTLTPAALRMAALEPDVYSALEWKSETESYLDVRRASTTTNMVTASTGSAAGTKDGGVSASVGALSAPTGQTLAPALSSSSAPRSSTASSAAAATRGTPRLLHGLFGFYWVLDDDIYGFYQSHGSSTKNERISTRTMMREVEVRLRQLRHNADVASPPPPSVPPSCFQTPPTPSSGSAAASPYVLSNQQQQQNFVFTCKEDALQNNIISGGKGRLPTLQNYSLYYTTACFSLEYNRFALDTAPDTLSVNSYNNIACLFNYALLHNPPQMRYFPPGVPHVRRPEDALVGYLDHSMLWYRFAVREDYDFTLQLIARGLHTLRFRSIAFDVPQMMKVRGGMTDYYRNCHEEIRQQNDRFVLQWPAVAQHWVKGKEGSRRDDIRVRWDLLSPARTKHPGAFLYLSAPLPQLQPQRLSDDSTGGNGSVISSSDSAATATAVEGTETETRKRLRPPSPTAPTAESSHAPAGRRPCVPAATASAPAMSSTVARDWKGGYVVERWRDISREEARQHAGLVALSNDDIHIGRTVAVIPPFFDQKPSVVRATVIERAVEPTDSHASSGRAGNTSTAEAGDAQQSLTPRVIWTAVAQDVRGMPFLHVDTCFEVPAEGIEKAAASIDQFFAKMESEPGS
ncbi:conserved hypothetical protein [Leishmania major strain Friedlin]|uniref:Uncharacterized protein n=1 Tax=Leishmania major TaxID=5664 RepID=Q4Q1I4_LEIMA|nr:conserved hypothetical protein [Leishmania major strain Friedlin]CAG9583769.1 hypothetical_protein_-_conserved [Leishmania major strain Friedlin]CAJ09195.1 conserved hypothetical protein [Leishmania major strain Friedlin]|eukprot:XP_001686814.1 conserved hypothetical protein [Leishmania major strain Friedlin]